MSVDDLFYNGKAKPGTLAVFSTGDIDLIETIPDSGKTFLWNSASMVFD